MDNMNLKYVNHKGVELNLTEFPIMIQSENLFDYKWQYAHTNTGKRGGVVTSFYRDVEEIDADLCFNTSTQSELQNLMNLFYSVTEEDVIAKKMGRLVLDGSYYMPCYIIGAENQYWSKEIRTNMRGIKILTEYPMWCKDKTYILQAGKTQELDEWLDFEYDMAYDYCFGTGLSIIHNDAVYQSDFRMIVQGRTNEIRVRIGNHLYHVETYLLEGEYAIIDSRDRLAKRYKNDGTQVSIYGLRDMEYELYKPIPAGENVVETSNEVELILYQERSEPLWNLQ